MAIIISRHGERLVVCLSEHISHVSRGILQDQVEKALNPEIRAVYFDMRDVTFINSIAIGDLVATKVSLDRKEVAFFIVAPSPVVAQLLKYTRLDQVLDIVADLPPDPAR